MSVVGKDVEYKDGDAVLEGYLAWDDSISGERPTVLIVHAWDGRTEFVCERARRIAALGYAAFCLDVYGKGLFGSGTDVNKALMQPFLDDREMLQQRLQSGLKAATEQAVVDKSRMIGTGYCFGGLSVLDLARHNAPLLGVISYHGALAPFPKPTASKIEPRVLVLHGYEDPMVPPDLMVSFATEMAAAQADWQIHAYGNTYHSFTNPDANNPGMGTIYSAVSDDRSWRTSLDFFKEIFS